MLFATVNGGFLSVFYVGSKHFGVVNISHMLFTDDTLLFCGANPAHLHYLCALFLCFKVVFDLKINLTKSELVPIGYVENVDGLAQGFFFNFEVSWSFIGNLL